VLVAAYCAAAQLACTVIMPAGTPRATIIDEASLYGARIALIDRVIRFQAPEEVAKHAEWFPLGLFMCRPVQNPFGLEGYRSFAYSTVEVLGDAPAAMLFPCAPRNGLYGAYKGFADCLAFGWSTRLPRLVACQPRGANSLEVSLSQKRPSRTWGSSSRYSASLIGRSEGRAA
jgi:threonine synthase